MFHKYGHHYGIGHQLASSMVHGFGWSIGSRIARSLPFGLIIILALIVIGWYVIRQRRV